jgi:hypothetical protein
VSSSTAPMTSMLRACLLWFHSSGESIAKLAACSYESTERAVHALSFARFGASRRLPPMLDLIQKGCATVAARSRLRVEHDLANLL